MSNPLRDELVEARDKVRRQIEIMSTGASSGNQWGAAFGPLMKRLNKTLGELEREIVRQDRIDAQARDEKRSAT